MKRIYSILLLCFIALGVMAQGTPSGKVQGIPYDCSKNSKAASFFQSKPTTRGNTTFTFDNIQFWVGEGENRAAFLVQWTKNDVKDVLVWGYRWSGTAYGVDMVQAIAKADPRLYALVYAETAYGSAIGGLGYDIDGEGEKALIIDNEKHEVIDGIVKTSDYDFDYWTPADENDYWFSGWTSNGFFCYMVRDDQTAEFTSSGLGASSRELTDGCWDAWIPSINFEWITDESISENFRPAPMPEAEDVDYSKGVFFLNEDWFGHNNSTINFLTEDGKWIYRAYQRENPGETLGVTSQYATIYGDKLYIMSKQNAPGNDGTPDAGRLIVTDANTLKKITSINELGGGDGRAFLGVDEKTAYVGTSNGIMIYDIENMAIKNRIEGTGGSEGDLYNNQIGLMLRVNDYVFAIHQNKGVFIIDVKEHAIVKTIDKTGIGTFGGMTLSKDGTVWVAAGAKLVKINPNTLDTEVIDLPAEAAIPDSWFAWTADVLFASNQTNTLYWAGGGGFSGSKKVFRYDIDEPDATPELIYDLTTDGNGWSLYHAAIRIHPVTDHIFMQLFKSFGSTSYTVYEIDPNGNKMAEYPLTEENYWFPALPLFPDNEAPVVSDIPAISNDTKKAFIIPLSGIATDIDNMDAAIVKKVISISDQEILTARILNGDLEITPQSKNGEASITLSFNSNGKVVEKDVVVNISTPTGLNEEKVIRSAFSEGQTVFINNCEGFRFIAYNNRGQAIANSDVNSINYSFQVDAPSGIYILKGENGKESVTFKIVLY